MGEGSESGVRPNVTESTLVDGRQFLVSRCNLFIAV
jgi:hypothetical protein